MKVHPAAELFPMMTEAELKELAADIKANGLRQPITKTEDDEILDGRNRLAACKIAGVEPEYITTNGVDPLAYVISLNVKRRNLSVAQRAMAAAGAYGLDKEEKRPESGLSGQPWYKVYAKKFGVSHDSVQQARALLERDPIAAEAVKNGEQALVEAYDTLRRREAEVENSTKAIARLRSDRPDLAELVEAGKLDRDEAMQLVDRDRREEEEAQRRYYSYFSDAMTHLAWFGDEAEDRARAEDIAERLEGTDLSADRFRVLAQTAAAIADAIERRR